jgi:phosphate transport system protein
VAQFVAHTARQYEEELLQIRESLLLMAGRVEQMISSAGRALVDRNTDLARSTIEQDRAVNLSEVEIDEQCLLILAKRQPMASDLRFVTLVMKMVTDLERIADLAVNICERTIDLSNGTQVIVHGDIPKMSQVVETMVKDAIDAFVNRDSSKAWAVIRTDDEVDELYHQVFEDLLERMRVDPQSVHQLIHVQSVAKWLERMGDHSTNLAELVIFMVEGRDVRHPDKRESR